MPTPSEHTRLSLEQRLGEHARTAWPQVTRLHVRHRGAFAYVEGELADGDAVELAPQRDRFAVGLCPLPRQQRQARGHHPAHRQSLRRPEDALDCACGLHLAAPEI